MGSNPTAPTTFLHHPVPRFPLPHVAAALEREAARRRVPVSQVAREAIEVRLGWAGEGPRELPFAALGASGLEGIAEHDEDYMREHWADAILGDR